MSKKQAYGPGDAAFIKIATLWNQTLVAVNFVKHQYLQQTGQQIGYY